MIRIIKQWISTTQVKKQDIYKYLLLSLLEVACYLFLPISYANIVTSASSQQIQLAYLWASTNFFTQILNFITSQSKHNLFLYIQTYTLTHLQRNLYKQHDVQLINSIITYIQPLNNFFMTTLKVIAILISASIYSLYLSFYILIALAICTTISYIIQKISVKKFMLQSSQEQKLSKISQNKSLIVNTIWCVFTFIITLITIDLFNNLKISITIFLLITTFINTHLFKPNFNINIIISTKLVKRNLDKYQQLKHTNKSE